MNKDDRDEIRELLQDVLIGHTNEMIGRLNVMGQTLANVNSQVIKTNGRVNDLEHDIDLLKSFNIEHPIKCPVAEKMKKLDDDIEKQFKDYEKVFSERIKPLETSDISRKAVTKFFFVMWSILGATVGALVFGILKWIFSGK